MEKTLLTLFSAERTQLQAEIDKATSVEQVVKLVQNRLDNLQRIYINQLNVSQVRLTDFFLDTLGQSIATLAAANVTQLAQSEPKSITRPDILAPKSILKLLQALICIGIITSSFSLTQTTPGAWTDILLAAVVLGLEVVLQLDKNKQENNTNLLKLPQAIVGVNSQVLLDNIADALHTIDLAIAQVEARNKPTDGDGIEQLPELLNFLQRLMGASRLNQPQMAVELAKVLPQILMEQGIRAQIYQPQNHQSQREYFDFEPSIDPNATESVTITPALLKGDRIIRRGRVIQPVYSEMAESQLQP